MKCEYKFNVSANCPVDGTKDNYSCIVSSDTIIMCESIVAIVGEVAEMKVTQEEVTQYISGKLPAQASITTTGFHSGIKTAVTI